MNILAAMNDPALFGKFFKRGMLGRDSWSSWRVFLAALFGLPIAAEQMGTYSRHTGRTDVSPNPYRESFCICGRRAGKSSIASLVALYTALFIDHTEELAPGEEGVVLLVAPDRKQCQQILGFVRGMLRESKVMKAMVAEGGELTESIKFTNGTRVEIGTANQRLVRGRTILAAIVDECAFLPTDQGSASPDTEIFAALRPAMLTVPNAVLLGISSPYRRAGVLWEQHKMCYGKPGADVLVWQASTRDMNPKVSLIEIGKAYLKDRAAAEAEYGAQFRSDLESFLGQAPVDACVVRGRHELPFRAGFNYVAFCDPSGAKHDAMTLAIAHQETENAKGVLDLVRQVRAPFVPSEVVREFCSELKRFHLSSCTGDRYSGEWVASEFSKHGVSYQPSARNKSELFLEVFGPILSGLVELLDNHELILQLSTLERRTTGRGRDLVDHGYGGFDDLANSAVGALVLALRDGAEFGVLDFFSSGAAAEFMKGIFRSRPPASKKSAVAAAAGKPAEARSEGNKGRTDPGPCPACGATCTTWIPGGTLEKRFAVLCNQCHAVDGVLPVSTEDTAEHVHKWRQIPGNQMRCDDCAAQTVGPGPAPPTKGMSRSQYEAWRRRLM